MMYNSKFDKDILNATIELIITVPVQFNRMVDEHNRLSPAAKTAITKMSASERETLNIIFLELKASIIDAEMLVLKSHILNVYVETIQKGGICVQWIDSVVDFLKSHKFPGTRVCASCNKVVCLG